MEHYLDLAKAGSPVFQVTWQKPKTQIEEIIFGYLHFKLHIHIFIFMFSRMQTFEQKLTYIYMNIFIVGRHSYSAVLLSEIVLFWDPFGVWPGLVGKPTWSYHHILVGSSSSMDERGPVHQLGQRAPLWPSG